MIEFVQAAILGIVEGLTEFIPVSSTGHLIVIGNLIGFKGQIASTFDIFIQLGAILAVVVLYRQRFSNIFSISKGGFAGSKALVLLLVSTIPAGMAGFIFHDLIIQYLFNPVSVSIGLAVGGGGILFVERFLPKSKKSDIDLLNWKDALIVGIFQISSLWPGVSRSAATIIGGMYAGMERKTAAEYSFLVAVPIMLSAALYDLYKSIQFLSSSDMLILALGFTVSFVSALVSVKFFLKFLGKNTMKVFGYYRLILAPLIILAPLMLLLV
ncbi:MAG: undecaprenyl-diphosphate phosphatase [Thaumarchaeota archaeon]|nr:undecaprenyl-diphosphate phosphatase [Nitrososphaerota archaeon]